ncbi:MAG: HEAT repeat domain-containing protein [Cyanobacteria bacterium J06643_5]
MRSPNYFFDYNDEEIRRRIAVVLERIVDESILEDLIQAFEDGKQNIQADLARLLKIIGNKNSTELLVSILLDKNPSARENLIRGLSRFGPESNIELLIQMVAGEKTLVLEKLLFVDWKKIEIRYLFQQSSKFSKMKKTLALG